MLWLEEGPGGVQMDGVGFWGGCLAQVLFSCASQEVSSGGKKPRFTLIHLLDKCYCASLACQALAMQQKSCPWGADSLQGA